MDLNRDGAERLMCEIVISGVEELRKLYKRYYNGRAKSPAVKAELLIQIASEESFLRSTWIIPYLLPDVTGEDIIKKLKMEIAECN